MISNILINIYYCSYKKALFLAAIMMANIALAEWRLTSFDAMGTRVEIEIWQGDKLDHREVFDSARETIYQLEQFLSPYIETSDVSRINRMAGQSAVEVDRATYQIIESAQQYAELSEGAFDISFASVGKHYDYRKHQTPESTELKALIKAIGYMDIALTIDSTKEGATVYSVKLGNPSMAIDLGGIAKGYTVDRVVENLREQGVESASISIGGDSYFLGDRGPVGDSNQRLPWMVGIRHPRPGVQRSEKNNDEAERHALRLPLVNTAFSTSGDYERYFIDDNGQRVHHIVNPRDGRSADGAMSVSIVGPKSVDCDALSTTVFVLGVKQGLELIESVAGYDAIIIDQNGKVHYSSGFR